MTDAMHRDSVLGFIKEHAVIAGAEPEQAFDSPLSGLINVAFACLCIAVQALEDVQSGAALDGADLRRHVRMKTDPFHRPTGRACSCERRPW